MINKPKLKKTTQHCLSLIILNHLQHTPWLCLHGQQIGSHLQLSAASSQPPAEGSVARDLPPHAKRTTFKLLPDHPDIYDWTRSTKGVCMCGLPQLPNTFHHTPGLTPPVSRQTSVYIRTTINHSAPNNSPGKLGVCACLRTHQMAGRLVLCQQVGFSLLEAPVHWV